MSVRRHTTFQTCTRSLHETSRGKTGMSLLQKTYRKEYFETVLIRHLVLRTGETDKELLELC
jgi:hypothetical protein